MRPIIIGTIRKDELLTFKGECVKLGWVYLGVEGEVVNYLDCRMTKHRLTLGEKTELIIV